MSKLICSMVLVLILLSPAYAQPPTIRGHIEQDPFNYVPDKFYGSPDMDELCAWAVGMAGAWYVPSSAVDHAASVVCNLIDGHCDEREGLRSLGTVNIPTPSGKTAKCKVMYRAQNCESKPETKKPKKPKSVPGWLEELCKKMENPTIRPGSNESGGTVSASMKPGEDFCICDGTPQEWLECS